MPRWTQKHKRSPERPRRNKGSGRSRLGDDLAQKANEAYEAGDFQKAVQLNEQAARKCRKDGANEREGQCYQRAAIVCGAQLGDFEGKIQFCVKAAQAFAKAGMYDVSGKEYEVASRVCASNLPESREAITDSAEYWVKAGEAFEKSEDPDRAGNAFRAASIHYERKLDDLPQAVEYATRAGECLMKAGLVQDAESSFGQARAIAAGQLKDAELAASVEERRIRAC
ncbi:MAG: hypothetical protein ABH851_02815 [Methanobacteriota archaeon]